MVDLSAAPTLAPGNVTIEDAVAIAVLPPRSYVRVRTASDPRGLSSIEVLGTRLPTMAGECSGVDPVAWWLAPETWLIASARHPATTLLSALESACSPGESAIVDVSDSLVAFAVSGSGAREFLSRGTGFDVRAPSFNVGRGTRVMLAQLAVLLRPCGNEQFELVVDRSVARWLADWLSAAASAYR